MTESELRDEIKRLGAQLDIARADRRKALNERDSLALERDGAWIAVDRVNAATAKRHDRDISNPMGGAGSWWQDGWDEAIGAVAKLLECDSHLDAVEDAAQRVSDELATLREIRRLSELYVRLTLRLASAANNPSVPIEDLIPMTDAQESVFSDLRKVLGLKP